MDLTNQQLELFETLLQTPPESRVIDAGDIKLYAEAVKVCTGDLMSMRPIPVSPWVNRYLIVLPY